MDTNKIIEVIPAAYKQGLLKPDQKRNVCFIPSINQANFLLYILKSAGENGLSTSQIEKRSGLHPNTCKCYLRELIKVGMVKKERYAQEEAIWYFQEK
ncbi:MAG: hypothetical protein ACIWVG_01220 [Gloeotrichia echinulata HAB0833]